MPALPLLPFIVSEAFYVAWYPVAVADGRYVL